MDGIGEHHLRQSEPGSEGQISHVLLHRRIIDSKKFAVMLLDMGHTLEETTLGRNRERKGNLKLECC
jgi:hypothetical protein